MKQAPLVAMIRRLSPVPVLAMAFLFLSGCEAPPPRQADMEQRIQTAVEKTPRLPSAYVDTSRSTYAWMGTYNQIQAIGSRIAAPDGYGRVPVEPNSFGAWLRGLPLQPGRPEVHLYDGSLKGNQSAHHAVIDLDVGKRDLQQCADAVMRLRAEYLYTAKAYDDIHFKFTSGDVCAWNRWRKGERPRISGNSVTWKAGSATSDGYDNFRAYMDMVFNYAGTASLSKELVAVKSTAEIQAGDVFIQGGFPGHAVIVVDVAEHADTGDKIFLLAQSYMPAQEMHVLRNPTAPGLSPWYKANFTGDLITPEWTFEASDLKRFR